MGAEREIVTWGVGAYCERFHGVLHAFRAPHPGPADSIKVNSLCSKQEYLCAPAYTVGVADHRITQDGFRRCRTCEKRLSGRPQALS